MTPTEVITFLRAFNEWRRGDEDIPQPDPLAVGEAIDAAIEMIERMEKQRDGLLGALRVIAARPARDEGRNNWEAIVWESISFAEEAIALCDEPDVHPAPSVPDEIERDVLRACCGTFYGSRHRITCEMYKGKKAPEAKP